MTTKAARGFPLAERPVPFGNGCGHDPAAPDFSLAIPPTDRLHKFLKKACDRVTEYYHDNSILPTVCHQRYNKRTGRCSTRKHRTDGAEGFVRLMIALLARTDLLTLRVLTWDRETQQFQPTSAPLLCAATGMSYDRLDRHRRLGDRAGCWNVHRRAERKPDGTWRGVNGVIRWNKAFFNRLGLGLELTRLQRGIYKAKKNQAQQQSHGADVQMLLAGTPAGGPRRSRRPGRSGPAPDRDRWIAERVRDLRERAPPGAGWTEEWCRELAAKEYAAQFLRSETS